MFSKQEVKFEHPAKGDNHCSQCQHFVAGQNKCKIVQGSIEPGDWCEKFKAAVKKFAFARKK